MVNKETLRKILLENRRLVEGKRPFPREISLPSEGGCLLTGIRGAGKSHCLHAEMQRRLKAGGTWSDMLYLNFEDERLLGFEPSDFGRMLAVHAELSGSSAPPALFLDEIRAVDGWEIFVRRMADAGADFIVTESAGTTSSVFGERFALVNVFPLSFSETLQVAGVASDEDALSSTAGRAAIFRTFARYLKTGGFPECVPLENPREALHELYRTVCTGDVALRYGIAGVQPLLLALKILAERTGDPVSFSALAKSLEAAGTRLSKATVIRYVEFASRAGLLLPIENIVDRLRQREGRRKYCFADNGFLHLMGRDDTEELLKNLVAVELMRRHGDNGSVFYVREKVEADFYVPGEEWAVQVCADFREDSDGTRRKIRALENIAKILPVKRRTVVTLDEERIVETASGSVEVVPAWKWLLGIASSAIAAQTRKTSVASVRSVGCG